MAYDKIIAVHHRLDRCIRYVLNPDKTAPKQSLRHGCPPAQSCEFVTGINCETDAAYAQMQATRQRWGKCGGVLGYHIIHAYAPGEATPQQAHAAGVAFAQRLLGERFEAVVATHLDRQHYHCHIVFNSVSFVDGKKYRSDYKAYFSDLRGVSNAVSREQGLTVIQPAGRGRHYAEWDAERRGRPTVASLIQQDIDAAIQESVTFGMFLSTLRRYGYSVKYGDNVKHTAIRPPDGKRFFRLSQLKNGYTESDIRARIRAARHGLPKLSPAKWRCSGRRNIPFSHEKPNGFTALYLYYLYLFNRCKSGRCSAPFSVRREVTKLKRYQRQFALIREYRIDNASQLDMLSDALQASIDALTEQRKALYRRRTDQTTAQINSINHELSRLRSKLKTCAQIKADIPRMRQQVQSCKEWGRHNQKGAMKKKNGQVDQSRSDRRFNPVR